MKTEFIKSCMLATVFSLLLLSNSSKTYAVAPQASISRSEAEKRAVTMMDLTWTYSADKNGIISSQYVSRITLPSQLINIQSLQHTGIPYNWGGLDGPSTHSYKAPWANFLGAISKGAVAGNVNTSSGFGYTPGTAGVDCSGFVQAVFNIIDVKQSTGMILNNYFLKIPQQSLKHMDILDKPGSHVVIFDKWGSFNGEAGAYTYESTINQTYGGIQGTKRYFMNMDKLNSGYIPARYKNIVDVSIPTKFKIGTVAHVSNTVKYAILRVNSSINNRIITTIPRNTALRLLSYSNGWYKTTYKSKTGWVLQSSLR